MDIEQIRSKINGIDERLLLLFLERMELAKKIAEYKNEHSLPITDLPREREILKRVKEEAGEKGEYAYLFFTKLIELSKAAQRDIFSGTSEIRSRAEKALLPAETVFPRTGTVACQDSDGAASQLACKKLLPEGDIMFVKTFQAVFDAVGSGLCRYGVLPIENSAGTSVRDVYSLLEKRKFSIIRSASLNIRRKMNALETPCDSSYTKFILIGSECKIYAGSDRISLIVTFPNKPGGLSDVLLMFSSRGINILKLEGCPVSERSLEFVFYIELSASVRDEGVMAILEELERTSESFTFLGNYSAI